MKAQNLKPPLILGILKSTRAFLDPSVLSFLPIETGERKNSPLPSSPYPEWCIRERRSLSSASSAKTRASSWPIGRTARKQARIMCITSQAEKGEIHFSIQSTDGTVSAQHRIENLMTGIRTFPSFDPNGAFTESEGERQDRTSEDRVYLNNFTVRKWKTKSDHN